MDASPDVLADTVRAKRAAVDKDLEVLRARIRRADPRQIDTRRWAKRTVPIAAAAAGLFLWMRSRRSVDSLERLLVHELTDLYQGEQRLLPALERMRAQASNEDLARAFDHHHYETRGHLERLERVFKSIGARPKSGSAAAVSGIVKEGDRLLSRKIDREVKDSWLIATAQRIEHLEIAGYGTARTYADTLGYTYAAQLLQQTLDEERATDVKLTKLAERFVNPQSIRSIRPE